MAKKYIHHITHEVVTLVKIENEPCKPDGTRTVRFKGDDGKEQVLSEQQFFSTYIEDGKVAWLKPASGGESVVEATEADKKAPWPVSRLREARSGA